MASSTSKSKPSARSYIIGRLARAKAKPASARTLGEAIVSREIIGGKYALANARKVIYSMHEREELERGEDGLYSLSEAFKQAREEAKAS